MANLMNNGILPLAFVNEADYDAIDQEDVLVLKNIREQLEQAVSGKNIIVTNETKGKEIPVMLPLSERQKDILLAGGLLNYTKQQNQ